MKEELENNLKRLLEIGVKITIDEDSPPITAWTFNTISYCMTYREPTKSLVLPINSSAHYLNALIKHKIKQFESYNEYLEQRKNNLEIINLIKSFVE